MARYTSIGMPKKHHIASSAEEAFKPAAAPPPHHSGQKRRRTDDNEDTQQSSYEPSKARAGGGWGRNPDIANKTKLAAERSEARREKRIADKTAQTVCYACRGLGHAARECPVVLEGSAAMLDAAGPKDPMSAAEESSAPPAKKGKKGKKGADMTTGKCYRCNSNRHSLSHCREPIDPENPTPFATCYVCLGKGHLSSLCPENPKGVYVKGGSCKICKSIRHRAQDCPELKAREEARVEAQAQEVVLGEAGADEDDFMMEARAKARQAPAVKEKKGKMGKKPPAKNGERGPTPAWAGDTERGADTPALSTPAVAVNAVSKPVAAKAKPKAKVVTF